MDCGNPSPVPDAQVASKSVHRFAGSRSQPFFALLIGCSQFLEILFTKADRKVDQITLRRPARTIVQIPVGVAVGKIVIAPVCEERAMLVPLAFWLALGLGGEIAGGIRWGAPLAMFDFDDGAHVTYLS